MNQGILFWATGERHQAEARSAIQRVQEIWPEVQITRSFPESAGEPPLLGRIRAMRASPYNRTLYLDSDTWLVEPVPELFRVLDRFHLAVPLAEYREVYPVDAPACFTEPNPGVLAWKRTRRTEAFFEDWERRFERHHQERGGVSHPQVGFFHSQPSFREALYHSSLRFATLPSEYNWRGSGYVHHMVKIVHKRPAPEQEAERINQPGAVPRTALLFGTVQAWK